MHRFSKRPSPSMVVACLALTVSLSGWGYAATVIPKNSVGTAQLKKNAVVAAKVKNGDRMPSACSWGSRMRAMDTWFEASGPSGQESVPVR